MLLPIWVFLMYINYPARFEIFGAVKIYELVKIHSLFAYGFESKPGVLGLSGFRDLEDVAYSTVFVIPVRDEEPLSLEGVLKAIPCQSPVIIISNSSMHPLNMYKIEVDIAKIVYKTTGRTVLVVHQKDKVVAEKLRDVLPEILDEESLVRNGKGEGILIGTVLADGLKARNVAFLDADNYVPSVALEYALIFYTVLGSSESKYRMARISWGHKAWSTAEDFYFRRFGRVSAVVNTVFNRVLSYKRRVETDIIKTSNSGEHAMSMEFAREIEYGSGFSVETQELISILEKCYVDLEKGHCPALPENIEIYQVESLSPHIHAEKGEAHVAGMILESLSTIYHSRLPDERGKKYILDTMRDMGFVEEPIQLPKYRYPSISARDFLESVITESNISMALGL